MQSDTTVSSLMARVITLEGALAQTKAKLANTQTQLNTLQKAVKAWVATGKPNSAAFASLPEYPP